MLPREKSKKHFVSPLRHNAAFFTMMISPQHLEPVNSEVVNKYQVYTGNAS